MTVHLPILSRTIPIKWYTDLKMHVMVLFCCLMHLQEMYSKIAQVSNFVHCIGVAPIMQLRTCVKKIVTFKGGHLMW